MTRRSRKPPRSITGQPATVAVRNPDAATPPTSRKLLWMVATTIVILVLATLAFLHFRPATEAPIAKDDAAPPAIAAHYVGTEQCTGCHVDQARDWKSSQHAHAMQHATAQTVLGDFNDARASYNGMTHRFFTRDGAFWVNTDGADGKPQDFKVAYTFGLEPLQQYLVAFPDGRLQALPFAWDSRDKAEGGQRWFHLYPGEKIDARDELHWTGPQQNWNFMCADCHSTNLRRNYDPAKDTFATTWSEINVGCESCHGPGSNHLQWAQGGKPGQGGDKGLGIVLDARRNASWLPVAGTGNVRRSEPLKHDTELETCAVCHSRRASISTEPGPTGRLLDTHMPALLSEDLYFDDGQQKDEVFIHGSFLQSKMHAEGVTCSDCHNPHSGKLKLQGNATCTQCHAPATYDTAQHHFHAPAKNPAGDGTQCVDCHMPTRTYMVNDPRRDHSFRVPRPDLSVKIGTPNACQACHADKGDAWAMQAVERWHGPQRKGYQHWAEAFHAARNGGANASAQLAAVFNDPATPAIARATALQELTRYPGNALLDATSRGLSDADPLVRIAALEALQPAGPVPPRAYALLEDDLLAVRTSAGMALSAVPAERRRPGQDAALQRAIAEYRASQQATASRAESNVNLGVLDAQLGDVAQAERDYLVALQRNPTFVPAYVNLAGLYSASGREPQAEQTLQQGMQKVPDSPVLLHAYALQRVRAGDTTQAVALLKRAVALAPQDARLAYVYAVALHSAGRLQDSQAALRAGLQRHPNDAELLMAEFSFARDRNDAAAARQAAERFLQAVPDDPRAAELRRLLPGL